MTETKFKTYEVRRILESGGWMLVLRTADENKAVETQSKWQDLVRSKGVFVEIVAVEV